MTETIPDLAPEERREPSQADADRAANPVTVTSSMTLPIATSRGPSCFGPQFSLSYYSCSGNGPFGLGWDVSRHLPTGKIDRRLKAKDLPTSEPGSSIWRYGPRRGGLWARAKRLRHEQPRISCWRSISKDDLISRCDKREKSMVPAEAQLGLPGVRPNVSCITRLLTISKRLSRSTFIGVVPPASSGLRRSRFVQAGRCYIDLTVRQMPHLPVPGFHSSALLRRSHSANPS
jgi:hypothetical protein